MIEENKIADELEKMEYEPLQPILKKFISWSIGLGIILLGILIWVNHTFFPVNQNLKI